MTSNESQPALPDTGTRAAKDPKIRAVDAGVDPSQWRKVHWITPILNSWQALFIIVAVVFYQNMDFVIQLANGSFGTGIPNILLIVLGGGLSIVAVIAIYSYLSWRATSYAATDEAVWMRTGILFRNQKHVRLERIQAVDVVHPLLGRIFGLGKLSVDSAGGSGGKLQIGFLKTEDLEQLRNEIMARAAGVYRDPVLQGADKATDELSTSFPGEDLTQSKTAPLQVVPKVVEAPEIELYSIPTGRLLGSIMVSGALIWSLVLLAVGLVTIVIAAIAGGGAAVLAALPGAIPIIFAAVTFLWNRFSTEFDFRAAVSPDGIRIRRGLLETRSETIPPRRIHAVSISQPFLWRGFGWYRVKILQASSTSGNDGQKQSVSSVLLPVGSRQEALLALWLVIPDLGVESADQFFDEALHGDGKTEHFIGVPTSARLFDPLTYKRKGVALTDTCMVVRDGRIQHRASFVTYERVQSAILSQGPWERSRSLANVVAATVPGDVTVRIEHLSPDDAAEVRHLVTERSKVRRSAEPPERWFSRVTGEDGPGASAEQSEDDLGPQPRSELAGPDDQLATESLEQDERFRP